MSKYTAIKARDKTVDGELLRRLRKYRKMTLKQVSRASGISISHLSGVERGVGNLSLDALVAWANALDFTIEMRFKEKKRE